MNQLSLFRELEIKCLSGHVFYCFVPFYHHIELKYTDNQKISLKRTWRSFITSQLPREAVAWELLLAMHSLIFWVL